MPDPIRSAARQLRTARRIVRRHRPSVRNAVGPLDDRLVFVLGSPRSGTTFIARSIASIPGFVDLGEVAALKAAIPELAAQDPPAASGRIHRILTIARRLGLTGGLRGVEQTPETAFVARAIIIAFPEARLVHAVRDGRDVVCSLLERGWLSRGRGGRDDAGLAYGHRARFWVEPERREEFARASDARRAAWAWRRYVGAGRVVGETAYELRYEDLTANPERTAAALARFLGTPPEPLSAALRGAHSESVGRFRRDLTPEQLADVEAEASELLGELGYL